VHLLEVAVGDLVVALGVHVELVVDAEVPPSVGAHAVFLDEAVLLPGRRPVLAPLVPVVEDDLPFLDQGPPMVIAPLVQFHGHPVAAFSERFCPASRSPRSPGTGRVFT
jgi:hypothetical protein